MKRIGFRWIARGSCRHPEIMTIRGGSLCSTDFPSMVGIISHPDHGILVFDTGYDHAFYTATSSFPERLYRWATPVALDARDDWIGWLKNHGIDRSEINGVIISHFHGDHVAGLHNFSDLPVHCPAAGLKAMRQGSRFARVRQGLLAGLVPDDTEARSLFFEDASLLELPSDYRPFTHGRDILGDGSVLAVELPGHCAGHWGLALRTHNDRFVLLAADAVWSVKAIDHCRPPPRITTALLGDTTRYRKTLAALNQAAVTNRDLAILPSHCPLAAVRIDARDAD